MLMARKVFKTGNSLVVSLPGEAMEQLGMGEGSEVIVELDRENGRILIYPSEIELEGVDREFAHQVDEFIEAYRPALEELAKNK
jgi:putative addiction module antidote